MAFSYSGKEITVQHSGLPWQVRVGSPLEPHRDGTVIISSPALSPHLSATLYVCEPGQPFDPDDGRVASGWWGWDATHSAQSLAGGFAKTFVAALDAAIEAMTQAEKIMAARRQARERLIDDMNVWLWMKGGEVKDQPEPSDESSAKQESL